MLSHRDLLHVSVMTNDVEYLLMCLLVLAHFFFFF